MSELDLNTRAGLPEALRVLLEAYPREVWEGHENFGQLVRFWLDRHMMFREMTRRMTADTEGFIDGKAEFDQYARRLSRLGGSFLNQLHGHHQIEDMHYFPQLVGIDARIERGFDMLETDHQLIDPMLNRFADKANALLTAETGDARRDAAGAFHTELGGFAQLLERHLTDEEDIIVPVILKSGFDG
ncbi:hemerythrin domain-containing protein [Psychromarinibacter sp. S121]|uniref:hemerythrin domain-containing protein n=1 Tax=Psychromarinibacter sp. S121 TaxID=3415127 RepID=UPI003C7DBC32